MPITTKGAVLWGVGRDWSIDEIQIGDPQPGEVTIQLAASGLCHSDHHVVTGATPMPVPVLGGHEGAGVVIKTGTGVTDLAEGDHVVTAFIPACGTCWSCSRGMQNLCDLGAHLLAGRAIADGTFRATVQGRGLYPMCLLGTFAPYMTCHQASVVKIDPDIPLDVAALVGCGVTTGWGSACVVADVRPGETVVVMGVGGVGMNAVQGAALAGAKYVVAVDPVEEKLEWAQRFGATHGFADTASAAAALTDLTLGRNADKTIVTVGVMRGEYVHQALSMTRKGGRCVIAGMGAATDMEVQLNLFGMTLLQKDLQGAIFGGCNPRSAVPWLLSMYQCGKLNLDDLITARYRLEDINSGYADMCSGNNIRGIIEYASGDYV